MSVKKLIFGRPGSGKTTLLVKEIIEALDDGIIVFTNVEVNWFGKLFLMDKFSEILNYLLSLVFLIFHPRLKFQRLKIFKQINQIRDKIDAVVWHTTPSGQEIPNIDLTDLYTLKYNLDKKLNQIDRYIRIIKEGLIQEYYYSHQNLHYLDNLEDACNQITEISQTNGDAEFLLAWDEGFIDLDFSAKPPRYITNFFNQTRKLQVNVSVATQRPVAVYPAFRSLCDYMVKVVPKWFNRFEGRLYWVDYRADSLPDLSIRYDLDGKLIDESEHYCYIKGKRVFPYFDTRQSVGLKRLFQNKFSKSV